MSALLTLEDHEAALCVDIATMAAYAANLLSGDVVAVVPPHLRSQVEHVARRLRSDALASHTSLDEIGGLAERLLPRIEAGTFTRWEASGGDVRGGHEVVYRTPEAQVLLRGLRALGEVRTAWQGLAAFEHAMRLRAKLPLM